ncbi:hypothetical protein Tco_0948584 [Tanacetum coccineum]
MRNKINLHTVHDDSLLGTLRFVSKTEDSQKYGALIPEGMINQDIKVSKTYKTYYDYVIGKVPPKKARKFKKHASPKLMTVLASPKEPAKKSKRVKRPAKKSTTTPTTGVVIRDTLGVSISKKKIPAKADLGKGIELLLDASLLEDALLKKALKKSTHETHKLQARTGVKPGVLDVLKADFSISDNESWGNSEDESYDVSDDDDNDDDNRDDNDSGNDDVGGNHRHDSERTDSDDDENPSLTLKDYEEAEQVEEEEYVHSSENDESDDDDDESVDEEEYHELYKDVNVRLNDPEKHEEGKGDEEMTDVGRDDTSQEKSYEQVLDDAHVTLTATHVTKKTDGFKQRSFVSFDFANQFLLEKAPPSNHKVASLMNVKVTPNASTISATTVPLKFTMITPLLQLTTPSPALTTKSTTTSIPPLPNFVPVWIRSKTQTSSQPKSTYEEATLLTEFELKKILLDKMQKSESYLTTPEHKELYDGLVKSINLDKDLFSSYGKAYSLKRDREDKDKDEDPLAVSDQGLKKHKISKDVKPSKGPKSKETKSSSSSKCTKPQPKSSSKSTHAEEPVFKAVDIEMQQDQGSEFGHTDDQPNIKAISRDNWFKKPKRPLTLDHDWNTTKTINFRPTQTWISNIAKAGKPPCTFDELINTPINFYAYVINHLKIDNLTQEHRVGPTFKLLKGTCKSRVELKYHFKECYKAVTDRLD